MGSTPRRTAGRLARAATVVAATVLGLAGCVSMPSSGPPNSLTVNQADTGQGPDYVGLYAAPPGPNWKPEDIVRSFLFASASYYTAGGIVRQYLTPQAQKTWSPGRSVTVSQHWTVSTPVFSPQGHGDQQATITVTGPVQATLNASGQQLYSSATQGSGAGAQPSAAASGPCAGQVDCYPFTLVKSGGQWRISKPADSLLLDQSDFLRAWQPQDLYFFDTSRKVLVPDSVFVPLGTSENDLLTKLAAALQQPPTAWLAGVTAQVFPRHITLGPVSADGNTAIVNLKGTLTAADREAVSNYVMAELVWTLTSASAGHSTIQSVQLNINGTESGLPVSRAQEEAYDPYPSRPASFTYVDSAGAVQSLCGLAQSAVIGSPVPVFGHSGQSRVAGCGTSAPTATPSSPAATASQAPGRQNTAGQQGTAGKQGTPGKPGQTGTTNSYSMAAVSPDGKYVAVVSANRDAVYAGPGPLGGVGALTKLGGPGADITSISWDRRGNLWVAASGTIWMVPISGKAQQIGFYENVSALSVAPDGVRVALIVAGQNGSGSALQLAAININGTANDQAGRPGGQFNGPAIGRPIPLGPGITNSTALAWYDADRLVVVTKSGTDSELEVVPVDGRAASQQLAAMQTPADASVSSIAAANAQNAVIVGLSNGQLQGSAGFEGPWQSAGRGYQPVYWIPAASSK
jgi:hypothetical protein